MRLDLFLKKTAVIKRRIIAKNIIEDGSVFLNGKQAKPFSEISDGDQIKIIISNKERSYQAIIKSQNGKESASILEL